MSHNREDSQISNAANLAHLVLDLAGQFCQRFKVGTHDLDRIGPFDTGDCLLNVVLDVLGEVEIDSGQLILKLRQSLVNQFFPGHSFRPLVIRLERHEKFYIGERGGVAPVVGPAML